MHIIIAGYGRVGRSLAHQLEAQGHSIAVIDRDPAAFEELDGIHGGRFTGEAFDRRTLEFAGIAKAECFCATTSGDNSNFVSARVAKELFGVTTVIARIYEPRRAAIYRSVGIDTISSVDWATGQFLGLIPGTDVVAQAASPTAASPTRPAPRAIKEGDTRPHTLIVGGGKSGAYLAAMLRPTHRVTLVELRADKLARLSNEMPDIEVIRGDGCEPSVLERAGVADVDYVAAATGDDEDNLVVAHLVKNIGSTATVVARVNHPANEWLFTPAWGVDIPISAAAGLYRAVAARCEPPVSE